MCAHVPVCVCVCSSHVVDLIGVTYTRIIKLQRWYCFSEFVYKKLVWVSVVECVAVCSWCSGRGSLIKLLQSFLLYT